MAIYDREQPKVTLPQLERRLKKVENGVDVTVKEYISEAFTTDTFTNGVAVEIKKIKGYTPYAVSAYMHSGTNYGYCNIYNVRMDNGTAKCGFRVLGGVTATDVKVKFEVIYIANKMLTAGTAAAPSSGGGGGSGTRDYSDLENKPSIEMVTLDGNKSFEDLGLSALTNQEIQGLFT